MTLRRDARAGRVLVTVLPRRERFAQVGAGAIATVVHQFALHSRYREQLAVLGQPVERPLDDELFVPVKAGAPWLVTRTRRYLDGVIRAAGAHARRFEVHNRPVYVAALHRRFPTASLALYLHNDPREMRAAMSAAERASLLAGVDAVICVSDYIRHCFMTGLDAGGEKLFVARNAVDVQAIVPLPAEQRRKDIIFIGRTIPDKGPHLLVDAALELLPRAPGWRLVVVGARGFSTHGEVQSYEKILQRKVATLGERASATGYLPHAQTLDLLRRAAIAVIPSVWDEPCPLAPIEAMAAGCAVITTRRGGIPEIAGDAASYLHEESAAGVAERLRELMDDPRRLRERQQAARAHAEKALDIRDAARVLDDIRARVMG